MGWRATLIRTRYKMCGRRVGTLQYFLLCLLVLCIGLKVWDYFGNSRRKVNRFTQYDPQKVPVLRMQNTSSRFLTHIDDLICVTEGTNLSATRKSPGQMACVCKKNWSGPACSFPEIAQHSNLNTSRFNIRLRQVPRRVVYAVPFTIEFEILEARFAEIGDIVDVFILMESNSTGFGDKKQLHLLQNMKRGFLQHYHDKIIYLQMPPFEDNVDLWRRKLAIYDYIGQEGIGQHLQSLRADDLILITDADELPSRETVLFLKLHEGYPEPVFLKLWSTTYGFFWKKEGDVSNPPVCAVVTASFVRRVLNYRLSWMRHIESYENYTQELLQKLNVYKASDINLVWIWTLGDESVFAGWHCSWCLNVKAMTIKIQHRVRFLNRPDRRLKFTTETLERMVREGIMLEDNSTMHPVHRKYPPPLHIQVYKERYEFLLRNIYLTPPAHIPAPTPVYYQQTANRSAEEATLSKPADSNHREVAGVLYKGYMPSLGKQEGKAQGKITDKANTTEKYKLEKLSEVGQSDSSKPKREEQRQETFLEVNQLRTSQPKLVEQTEVKDQNTLPSGGGAEKDIPVNNQPAGGRDEKDIPVNNQPAGGRDEKYIPVNIQPGGGRAEKVIPVNIQPGGGRAEKVIPANIQPLGGRADKYIPANIQPLGGRAEKYIPANIQPGGGRDEKYIPVNTQPSGGRADIDSPANIQPVGGWADKAGSVKNPPRQRNMNRPYVGGPSPALPNNQQSSRQVWEQNNENLNAGWRYQNDRKTSDTVRSNVNREQKSQSLDAEPRKVNIQSDRGAFRAIDGNLNTDRYRQAAGSNQYKMNRGQKPQSVGAEPRRVNVPKEQGAGGGNWNTEGRYQNNRQQFNDNQYNMKRGQNPQYLNADSRRGNAQRDRGAYREVLSTSAFDRKPRS